MARGELDADGRPDVPQVIILLTDGQPDDEVAGILTEADEIRAAGTEIFTVGVGNNVNAGLLDQIATDPDAAHAFLAADFDDLLAQVEAIARLVCEGEPELGALAGAVYVDAGDDGLRGDGEAGIPGATVILTGSDDGGRGRAT